MSAAEWERQAQAQAAPDAPSPASYAGEWDAALDVVVEAAATLLALRDSPILPGHNPKAGQDRLREALGIIEASR